MEIVKEKTIIGFIGTGVMGNSMARHIMNEGFKLIVYTRSKEKAQDLLENGARWAVSPEELAQQADVIISMVGYPKDVEEIYLGEKGILKNSGRTKYVIDMTTSTPSLAGKIYKKGLEGGVKALDAPVSGGDIGARERKLTIMAGGSKDDFEDIKSILEIFGTNIIYQGEAGAGQHTKMCNQIAIASNMIGVAEAVVYAKKAGLDPEKVLQSISAGAAGSWSLSNLAPRMIKGDFAPGFYIKHFIKDMGIALEEAEKMQMDVPGLKLAKSLYEELAEAGEESSGTQAILKHWS